MKRHWFLNKVVEQVKKVLSYTGRGLVLIKKNELHIGSNLPKYDFHEYSPIHGYSNVGIVLQGPIDEKKDFTLNSLRFLRHLYPDVKLCVSTYYAENYAEQIASMGCELIENTSQPTENKGEGRKVGHLNNQLLSSLEGIKYLRRQGVEYVMKMRTDCRIYKNDFIPYLMNMIQAFPCATKKQNCRLVNVAFLNSLASVPFFVSDFIMFGSVEDMEKLYSIPSRTKEELRMLQNTSNEQYSEIIDKCFRYETQYNIKQIPLFEDCTTQDWTIYYTYREEAYIMHTYATEQQLLHKTKTPLEDYYQFIKDYMIVVDETEMMAYFDKYVYSVNSDFYSPTRVKLSHSIWMDIMLNYNS